MAKSGSQTHTSESESTQWLMAALILGAVGRMLKLRRTNLQNGKVPPIGSRRRVVDGHIRPTQRRCTVLHLHPVRVSRRCQILIHQALPCSWCPGNTIVVVVANTKDPGIIACRGERGGGRTGGRAGSLGLADGTGPVGSGSVHPA